MQRNPLFTPRVLWFALLTSLGIYGFVLQVQPPREPPLPPAPIPSVVLWALTIVLLGISAFVLPMLGRRQQRQAILRTPAQPERAALAAYQTSLILRLALCEAAALLGFVDAFTAGRPTDYVSSGVVAALVMIWHFPTRRRALLMP